MKTVHAVKIAAARIQMIIKLKIILIEQFNYPKIQEINFMIQTKLIKLKNRNHKY